MAQVKLSKAFEDCETLEKIKDEYPGLDFLNFQDILSSKTRWYKLLWIVVFICNLIVGALCSSVILSEYYARPTATLISYKSVKSLPLPQVTICGTVPDHMKFDDFFRHAVPVLPNESNSTILDLLVFILGGSGFQKFETVIDTFNETYIAYLNELYLRIRGNMTAQEYFIYGQDLYGMQCRDVFQQCKLGSDYLDCCKIFAPTYTLRRGKCFRSKLLEQGFYDEQGKLGLRFKEPPKLFPAWSLNEMLIFLNEYNTDIEPYPRFYMYIDDFNKFRVATTHLSLIPYKDVCSESVSEMGKSTCYLENWLIETLEDPFNCTYPYMFMLRNTSVQSCEPETIVRNYNLITKTSSFIDHNCTLACDRWEYSIQVEKTVSDFSKEPYRYRADINYNDLQYQDIKEIATITFLGLVSQMGSQLGLFLGSSLIDLIQLALLISILVGRYARERFYGQPVRPIS